MTRTELEEYRQWLKEPGDKLAALPDLRGARLSEADRNDATLREADLSGANIRGAGRPETDHRDQHGREG